MVDSTKLRCCTRCRVQKALETEFHRDSSNRSGYSYRCKECQSAHKKVWSHKITSEQRKRYHPSAEVYKRYHERNRMKRRLRKAIRKALNRIKKDERNQTIHLQHLGYTSNELKKHLDNWLNKLCERCHERVVTIETGQIDHIIPLKYAKQRKDIAKFNQLRNLRLICAKCNQEKGAKLEF